MFYLFALHYVGMVNDIFDRLVFDFESQQSTMHCHAFVIEHPVLSLMTGENFPRLHDSIKQKISIKQKFIILLFFKTHNK